MHGRVWKLGGGCKKYLCGWGSDYCKCKDEVFETMENYKSEGDAELEKGIVHHANGGISWLNPKFLGGVGHFDGSQLPF
jgi:hypothetical protein